MPIQTWTAGQQLTAAELTAVTNMLPAPQVATSNVASAVPGTLYRCQPSGAGNITITLPQPTLGSVVGMTLESSTGSCTITHNATEFIYGVDVDSNGARGAASLTLSQPDAYVVVIADGANWHEYGTLMTTTWKFFDTTLSSASQPIVIPASGSIPTGPWSTLEIDCYIASTTSSSSDVLAMRVNGVSSGNQYNAANMSGSNAAAASDILATDHFQVGSIAAATSPANVFDHWRIVCPFYTTTNKLVFTAEGGLIQAYTAGNLYVTVSRLIFDAAGPLTSVTLYPAAAGASFAAGTRVVARLVP